MTIQERIEWFKKNGWTRMSRDYFYKDEVVEWTEEDYIAQNSLLKKGSYFVLEDLERKDK